MAQRFTSPADPEFTKLLVLTGDNDERIAVPAQRQFAQAIQLPLRQGVLDGDITGMVFNSFPMAPGAAVEFPLDLYVTGNEGDYTAYTIPNHGRIPERMVESDYVTVPTYEIGNSIDWLLKYARDARWDVVGKAMAVMETGFIRKLNLDGWSLIIAAAVDRNVVVYDTTAVAGYFTKRLVSLMKLQMRRSGGGNTTAANPRRLTDVFVSPEGLEDMRTWDLTQVDDMTRREIFVGKVDGGLGGFYQVGLHELLELGEGQPFQTYFLRIGGTFSNGDLELVVGLDLSNPDIFMMPIKQPVEVFEDPTLHRQRRAGYYGWGEQGFAILDNRAILLGTF